MASQKKLCVRSDGSFKVMQIADLQEIPAISPDTLKLMKLRLTGKSQILSSLQEIRSKATASPSGAATARKRWRIPCTGCWSQWSDVIFPLPRSLVITTAGGLH